MVALLDNYRPTEDEPFMNEKQKEYFRLKLLRWRDDILREAKQTLQHLQEENVNHPDLADRATFAWSPVHYIYLFSGAARIIATH